MLLLWAIPPSPLSPPGPWSFCYGKERNGRDRVASVFYLALSAVSEVLWLEGQKLTAFFHGRLGVSQARCGGPELSELSGGLYGSGDKQISFRAWVTIDDTRLVSVPFSQALEGVLPFALLRQLNRLEALGASGMICWLETAVKLPSASLWANVCQSRHERVWWTVIVKCRWTHCGHSSSGLETTLRGVNFYKPST